MTTTTPDRTDLDAILAHRVILRITDRLLQVAQELREARDRLPSLLDRDQSEKEKDQMNRDSLLKWFAYDHLAEEFHEVCSLYFALADKLCDLTERGPERTVALRKLLDRLIDAAGAKIEPSRTQAEAQAEARIGEP